MHKLKLTQIGNSVGVVLPKEMLTRMKVGKGDSLCAVETAEGYLIKPYDEEFEEDMKKFESILKRYRNAFRELAK